jgi:hypothetical protein
VAEEPPAELAKLAELWQRLRGGIYQTSQRSRPVYVGLNDTNELEDWPGDQLAPLDGIRQSDWGIDGQPEKAINDLASQMQARRSLIAAVTFRPDAFLVKFRNARSPRDGERLVDTWVGMCWLVEAAWRAVTVNVPESMASDAALLRPLAARLRFLVLSEPMRWRGRQDDAWWAWPRDLQELRGGGIVDRSFGPSTWPLLLSRCREARREWQECLDVYQSHPLLSRAGPKELEEELDALIFRHAFPGNHWHAGTPLGLPPETIDQPTRLTAEDQAFVTDVTDQHLLPRFDVAAVARLGLFDDDRAWRWGRRVSAGSVLAAGAAAVGCAAALDVNLAAVLAAACYLLICAGVVMFPQQWGAIWLLRMPAASAVGIIALISLLPAPWFTNSAAPTIVTVPPRGWVAALVLVAISYGYLLVQARNHGVGRRAALGRALGVLLIGAVHAVLVSLVGLDLVGPAFVGNGHNLIALMHKPEYGQAGLALALSAAWCLAVGVFSQILWQDRPITATLAHMSWRKP